MGLHKKTKKQIVGMSGRELSAYISEITQTPICKDKKYCDFVIKEFIKKPLEK